VTSDRIGAGTELVASLMPESFAAVASGLAIGNASSCGGSARKEAASGSTTLTSQKFPGQRVKRSCFEGGGSSMKKGVGDGGEESLR
jgi:hypothetical protein